MEIPPNILKELEEKKAQAVLAGAAASNAVTAAPEKPLMPLLTPYAPFPEMGVRGERGEMGGEMGEKGKPSGGEIFFGYLAKIAVLAAVFLTPLFFFTASDSLNLPKQLLLSVLALTALAAWVGESVAAGKITWRRTGLEWPLAGVALAVLFSSVFSSSFWVSFLGDTGRYSGAGLSILSYIVLAAVGSQVMGETPTLRSGQGGVMGKMGLVWAWLGSVFLIAVYALLQFFGIHILGGAAYASRLFNPIGSPFALGLFVLSSVPFLIAMLSKAKPWKLQGLALVVMLMVQLAAAAIVDFRVGWIALAAAALVLAVRGLMGKTPTLRSGQGGEKGKMGLALGAVVLAALLWLAPAPQIKDLNFPAEINPSYGASLDILAKNWREKPIFGSGLETYPYVYAKFKSAALNQTNYWGVNFNDAAADSATWATTTGLFGTLAWLAFVFWVLVYGWRRAPTSAKDGVGAGLLASWIFILATKFFYPTPLPMEFFFWFLPVMMIKGGWAKWDKGDERGEMGYRFQQGSAKTLTVFFGLLVLLLGALGGLYFSVQRWRAEKIFVRAITLNNAPTPEGRGSDQSVGADPSTTVGASQRDEVVNGIYSAIAADPYEARYFRVLAQALFAKMNDVVAGINTRPEAERRAKPEETALLQNLTVRTINAVQRAGALDPQNVGVAVDAAESYRDLVALVQGADDLAIQNYEKASGLEPINPFIKTQLGQLYLIKSNAFNYGLEVDQDFLAKARGVLDETLKLNPNYANARYFFALIQDKDGQKQEALQNFLILRQTNPNNQLLTQIVANLQQGLPALGVPPQPATPPQSPKAKETKGEPK